MTDFVIRAARPAEAGELGALALRSKAHWGYDAAFLEASRDELMIPADKLAVKRTYVAVAIPSMGDGEREGEERGEGNVRVAGGDGGGGDGRSAAGGDGVGAGGNAAGGAGGGGGGAGGFAAGRILGFGTVEGEPPAGELGMLFVDPPAIGQGVGSALFSYLTAIAIDLGFHRLTIAADPNAEPFYLAKGAVRIGGVPSGSVPGRVLPLLALAL